MGTFTRAWNWLKSTSEDASTVDLGKIPTIDDYLDVDGISGDPCTNCGHVHLEGDYWVRIDAGECAPDDAAPTIPRIKVI